LQHFNLKALIFVALIGFFFCSSFGRRKNNPTAFTTWANTAHYSPVVGNFSFINKTNQPYLSELVRFGFYSLFPLPFYDRALGDIDGTLELLQKKTKKSFYELPARIEKPYYSLKL
jgi:hypothetical protein